MKALSDPIWHPRLQVLWIVLSAVYAASAKSRPERSTSSVLILIAGALLVTLFGHVLFKTTSKANSVLLVAFGSSVFLANVSYSDFKDPLAAAFAIIFALMTGSLLSVSIDGRLAQQLRYRYFVAIILTVVAGGLGLPLTLLEKAVLDSTVHREGYYVAGIQGLAAGACFAIGLCVGSSVLPSSLPHNRRTADRSIFVTLPLCATLPAMMYFGLYSKTLQTVFPWKVSTVSFVVAQTIGLVAVPVMVLKQIQRRGTVYPWQGRALTTLLLAAVSTAFLVSAHVELLRQSPNMISWGARAAIVEVPTYVCVYATLAIGITLASRAASSARQRIQR